MGLKKVLLFILICGFTVPTIAQDDATFDSLSKALLLEKKTESRIQILLSLSRFEEGSNPVNSIKYASEAYNLAVKNKLDHELLLSLNKLSRSYIRISDYQKAYNYAEMALKEAENQKNKEQIAKSRGIMSLIYYEIGDFENSAKLDFENLAYYEKIGDSKQIGIVLGNIGIDFINQKNYEKGLFYLKESFEIAEKGNDLHGMAYQYNNIAGVYSEFYKDHKIALGYYKEAQKINASLNDNRQNGIYLMNIGSSYSKLDIKDSALFYYKKALAIFQDLQNQDLTAECQTLIGSYYLDLNNLDMSYKYGKIAIEGSILSDSKENIKRSAGLLHKILLRKGDTIKAYRYAAIERAARDSLVEKQNRQEIYKLEFQYNLEKLDKDRKLAQQRKDNIMLVVILSLSMGLIIILLMFSRNRIRAKNVMLQKETIEQQLNFKDKELTINLISLIKKNELLADISGKLIQIGKNAKNEETKDAISKISRDVRNSADDKLLKEFGMRFQEVHAGFYEKLLERFPDLTQNELKLCAFLRLNMSSKDISELTGQRILTIDHARYRLRKKLGISNVEVNLVAFLSQI
ncbi:MAG: hypothetical protein CVT94_17430 [Bacteroidetes bacterium HGW-Bacteroidetes-11]|jgi:tetratricopeptide (TPR) repeat protein|nr:MAG: hypothetical protein CVT94_17430 [Bacteroidetes bacterium HGW-Bacteroidetes-11]